ncbi:hypothetical protein FQR65_LT11847 [Abscondita terminalis]|nr:hypothetical protein FQR65_LT11847 [Abscondita terminalis]
MKVILSLTVIFAAISLSSTELRCEHGKLDIPTEWKDMVDPCVRKMREQIQEELQASIQYLAMGAHFSKDTVNRPGFAKHFFEAASEERQHALKLISYLLMRGELTSKLSKLIKKNIVPTTQSWADGLSALKDALKLEAHVTQKIREVIKVCEAPGPEVKDYNDYHLVDYLTGEFLDEQHKGQRELAGKISTLEKMKKDHKDLGEFMFDKKLLED